MDASSPQPDAASELNELRRRAYGPHPDIQDDPAALAQLRRLEAAHPVGTPAGAEPGDPVASADARTVAHHAWADDDDGDGDDEVAGDSDLAAPGEDLSVNPSPSLWNRLTATRARRGSFLAGALLGLIAVGCAVGVRLGTPNPDATLHQVAGEPTDAVLWRMDFLEAAVDLSTARGYEPYRGVEPWFAVDEQGFECFMVLQPVRGTVDGANCVPPGVDLFADINEWALLEKDRDGLPDGSIIRFHYRGGSVDAFDHPGP